MPSWHAKFSASGMERTEMCPGSVELSATQPDRDTPWSIEGTKAHKVLEVILTNMINGEHWKTGVLKAVPDADRAMFDHGCNAAKFILNTYEELNWCDGNAILVESKVLLDWIHHDLGGTFDGAVIEVFGVLHVFDYKYGAGHQVSAAKNLQLATYGIGLARKYGWNFHTVRLWIIQPRIKSYDGPTFWDVSIEELRTIWQRRIKDAVHRAVKNPKLYVEGSWCHWCKAKPVCPLKVADKREKARSVWE